MAANAPVAPPPPNGGPDAGSPSTAAPAGSESAITPLLGVAAIDYTGAPAPFLLCGCPRTQGCECFLYTKGCAECFNCLANRELEGKTGELGTAPCFCATGYNRINIGGYELAYPRSLLDDAGVRECALAHSLVQLRWARVVYKFLLAQIHAESAQTCERMEAMEREMMMTEDLECLRFYPHLRGAYVDASVLTGAPKRIRRELAFADLQKEMLRVRLVWLGLHRAEPEVRRAQVEIEAFQIVRWVRGWKARRWVRGIILVLLRHSAATLIQTLWRGFYIRKYVWAPLLFAHRTKHAKTIQRTWRSYWARKPYRKRLRIRRWFQRKMLAVRILAIWRGWRARRLFAHMRERTALAATEVSARTARVATVVQVVQRLREEDASKRAQRLEELRQIENRPEYSILTVPRAALEKRMQRDMHRLIDAVQRQCTAHVAAIAKVDGRGKWSRGNSIGTTGMLRRFRGREHMLTGVYQLGVDDELGYQLPAAVAALRRSRPDSRARARTPQAAWLEPSSPLTAHPILSSFEPCDELFASIDEPVLVHEHASGMPMDEWLTYAEISAVIKKKKQGYFGMTTWLEERAAAACAQGLVDTIIEAVTAYVQHLQLSHRRMERDLEIATYGRLARPTGPPPVVELAEDDTKDGEPSKIDTQEHKAV